MLVQRHTVSTLGLANAAASRRRSSSLFLRCDDRSRRGGSTFVSPASSCSSCGPLCPLVDSRRHAASNGDGDDQPPPPLRKRWWRRKGSLDDSHAGGPDSPSTREAEGAGLGPARYVLDPSEAAHNADFHQTLSMSSRNPASGSSSSASATQQPHGSWVDVFVQLRHMIYVYPHAVAVMLSLAASVTVFAYYTAQSRRRLHIAQQAISQEVAAATDRIKKSVEQMRKDRAAQLTLKDQTVKSVHLQNVEMTRAVDRLVGALRSCNIVVPRDYADGGTQVVASEMSAPVLSVVSSSGGTMSHHSVGGGGTPLALQRAAADPILPPQLQTERPPGTVLTTIPPNGPHSVTAEASVTSAVAAPASSEAAAALQGEVIPPTVGDAHPSTAARDNATGAPPPPPPAG